MLLLPNPHLCPGFLFCFLIGVWGKTEKGWWENIVYIYCSLVCALAASLTHLLSWFSVFQPVCSNVFVVSGTLRLILSSLFLSASRAEDLGFKSCLWQDFSESNHTSDLKIGTPVVTLPGAWHYRVSAGTDRPSVSILWLGEVESLICSFYLSVAALKRVWADPSLKYAGMLLGL